MEKRKLYNQIMEQVSKEVKKALNENANENINIFDYQQWKRVNGPYLEKFIKEYLSEHLSVSAFYDGDEMGASLLIDGNEISCGSDRIGHCGYEE